MVERLKVQVTEIHRFEWVCPKCATVNSYSATPKRPPYERWFECKKCKVEVWVEQAPWPFVLNNVRVPYDMMVAAHYSQYGHKTGPTKYNVTPKVCFAVIEALELALTDDQINALNEADWS